MLLCSRLILTKSKTINIKYIYSFTVICCHSVSISATGASTKANSNYMGTYEFYKKSSNGWPVYKKGGTGGVTPRYFYLSNMGYWSVSLNQYSFTISRIYDQNQLISSTHLYFNKSFIKQIGRDFESSDSETMGGFHQTCLERCPNLCTNSWGYDDQGTWKLDSTIQVSCGNISIFITI